MSVQSVEFLIVGIVVALLLIFVTSLGFYLSVRGEKSKSCVRSCPFSLWSISNTLLTVANGFVDVSYTAFGFFTIRNTLASVLLIVAAVSTYQYHGDVLRNVDDAWRVFVYPVLHDVLEPLILLARFFYNLGSPIYNLYIGIVFQATRGSAVIIGKCQVDGLYDPLRHFGNGTVHTAEGLVDFLSDVTRPINITDGLHDFGMAIHSMDNGLKCACKQTELVTDVVFYGPSILPFAHAANSLINVPIQFTRDLVTAFFGGGVQMPTFEYTFAFANDALIKFAVGVDQWAYYAVDRYGIIDKEFAPEQSLASAAARTAVAALSVPEDVVSGSLNLFNAPSREIIRSSYSFDHAWRNLDVAAHAVGETLYFWIDNYYMRLTGEEYVAYDCEWGSEQEFIRLGLALGCGAEHLVKAVVGVPHVAWSTTINSVFRDAGEDVLTVLQRHDGAWMKRTGLLTCEYRKAHSINKETGDTPTELHVDFTTDSSKCECEVDSYYVEPTKGYKYNPWCGQPTLQAQVFNPAESFVVFVSRGLFGPLAGIANAPLRLGIEAWRILIRISLSIPDMIQGQWAQRQMGCGYGVPGNQCSGEFSFVSGSKQCMNNANSDCFCNYEKPIDASSMCQCISDYPIFTTTFEETQNVDTLFQKSSARWCNTQIFENFLTIIEESGQSLAFTFDWLGKELNAAQNKGKKCYHFTVAELSTTANLGGVNAAQSGACAVYGHQNVFCGLGGSSKAFIRTATGVVRQAATNVIKLLQGDIEDLNLDMSLRICDLERTGSMLASSVSGSLIFANFPQREAVAKLLFALEGVVIVPVKIVHRIYYSVVSILQNLMVSGRFDGSKISNTLKTLIVDCIRTVFDSLKLGLRAFEEFFNSLVRGGGKVFKTLREALENIETALTSTFLDILAEVTNIFIQFVSMISGKTDFGGGVVSMLKSMAKIIGEFVSIASKNIMLLLDAILGLLGGFGKVIKTIAGGVCNIIKDIVSLPIMEVLGASGDDIQCFDGRRLSVGGAPHITVTKWASEVLNWNGTTTCDILMRETTEPLEDLTVLERATWEECLMNRFMSEKIAETVDIPELKLHDLLYNWQRKYEVGYEMFENFRLSFGLKRRIDVYHAFLDARMDTVMHMKIYDRINSFASGAWKALEYSVNDYSSDKIPPNTAKTFNKVMGAVKKFNSREWVKEKQTFWKAFEAVPHLMNISKDGKNPFRDVASKFQRTVVVADTMSEEISGAAIFTDIGGEQGFTQCRLVDNFFDMLQTHTEAIGAFYARAIPETISDFETYNERPSFESKLKNNNLTGATTFNNAAEVNRWEFVSQDWQNLFDGDRLNEGDVTFVIDAVAGLFTRTNSSYVPLFGYGLPYLVLYPIFESCDIQKSVFVNETYEFTKSREERVADVSQGLLNAFVYTLLISYSSVWCPFPVGPLQSYLLIVMVSWYIYLFTVYEFVPTCSPNMPYTLMDDFYSYVKLNRAHPDFCSYVPLLYPGDCGSAVGDAPVYLNCEDLVEGFQKINVTQRGDIHLGTPWWSLITFARHNIGHLEPVTWFVSLFGEVPEELRKWKSSFDLTPEEITCMKVQFPVVIVMGTAFVFLVYVTVKFMIIGVKTGINAAITTFTLYNHTRDIVEILLEEEEDDKKNDPYDVNRNTSMFNMRNVDADEEEHTHKLDF